jgi:hypothetical protein
MSDLSPLDVDLTKGGGHIPLMRLHLLAEAHRLGAEPEVADAVARAVAELHVNDPVTPRAFLTALSEVAAVMEQQQ